MHAKAINKQMDSPCALQAKRRSMTAAATPSKKQATNENHVRNPYIFSALASRVRRPELASPCLRPLLNEPNSQGDHSQRALSRVRGESDSSTLTDEINTSSELQCDGAANGASDFFGLPPKIKYLLLKHRKIEKLYDWQSDLMSKIVKHTNNVIYCVPTSGGKTLVAELMIMKELLCNNRNCIMVLPYISIVQEKVRSLQIFAQKLNFLIEEYAGAKGRVPPSKHCKYRTLYIATIEKAHVLITSLFEQKRLGELGLMVIDELHMVGDGTQRGATLEALIVKTKLSSAKEQSGLRLIGMSATLNNLDDLKRFLAAEAIENKFRPIALKEFVKLGPNLYEVPQPPHSLEDVPKVVRTYSEIENKENPDHLLELVQEVIGKGSCLIFCPTKLRCQNVALNLARLLPAKMKSQKCHEKKQLMVDIYQSNEKYICPTLGKTIPFGIAYHHSGLTSEEREFIEAAFMQETICCIVCTSTLAAGVNLPAQRVIIRAPFVGRNFLEKSQYKQMCGRAGRAGFKSEYGESILICTDKEKDQVKALLEKPISGCISTLAANEDTLAVFVLNLFHLQLVFTAVDVEKVLAEQTLFGIQLNRKTAIKETVSTCIRKLEKHGLMATDNGKHSVTELGNAVVKSLITLQKSKIIFDSLTKAADCLSVRNYMHLTYLATLLFEEAEFPVRPDSAIFYDAYFEMTEEEQKTAILIGMKPYDVTMFRKSGVCTDIINRFYITMIVFELWKNSSSIGRIANRYNIQRGTLQTLLAQVANHASSLLRFVEEIATEFWAYRSLLPELCKTLSYCCVPEIVPLMELPAVKIARAKQLYQAGFKDIVSVAKATETELTTKITLLNRRQAKYLIRDARHIIRGRTDELEETVHEMQAVTLPEVEQEIQSSAEPLTAD